MSDPLPLPRLRVRTTPLDDIRLLIPLLDPREPLLWMRKGQGVAGIGIAATLSFSGASRMRDAAARWREVAQSAIVDDPIRGAGTGLIAFGAFAFADQSDQPSSLIVPRTVIGRRDGVHWITQIWLDGEDAPAVVQKAPAAVPVGTEYRLSLLPGTMTADGYRAAVGAAVERILTGDVEKVVLARDLVGRMPREADVRRALIDLALGYPDCWTYSVDGLFGSSPETLVSVDRGTVSARVLAGTIARGRDAEADQARAIELATSSKDLDEHHFAVTSLLQSLEPHTRTLSSSELPFTLKLPNLWHLASDVEGTLGDGSSSLDLIAALHPTAAVAGTPTDKAIALIAELEPFDRGRYAGPVGWVGADGDGEWAIALRCGQVNDDGTVTAYAGAGILAESDPEREFIETRMKFRPIVEALG